MSDVICVECGYRNVDLRGSGCPRCNETRSKNNVIGLPNAKATFERALGHITGPRRTSYGPVRESFERAALAWSGILGTTITAEQVVLCMAGYKLTREANAHNGDNIDDACGYLGLLAELNTEPLPQPSNVRVRRDIFDEAAKRVVYHSVPSSNGYAVPTSPTPTAL